MPVSGAQRHDLYDGLNEILGAERADTLMAYLPAAEASSFATKDDIEVLHTKMGGLETRMGGLETRMGGLETRMGGLETRMGGLETRIGGLDTRIDWLNRRLDRMLLTLVAGFVAVVGTTIATPFLG